MSPSRWPSDAHPPLAELERSEPDEALRQHLAVCARCRVDRRLLLEHDSGEARAEPYEASWTATGTADALLGSWLSARSAGLPSRAARRIPPPTPEDLGPYRIDAELGQGGMAVVYRGRHLGRPQQPVALKWLLRPDAEQRTRLRREGQVQLALRHDNVVRVIELLEIAGEPALVMEYVPGPSLREALREHRPSVAHIDSLARGLLRGVAAAHAAGIVHRDLKPGNVLLCPVDGGLQPKVADFGLARANTSLDSLMTRTGAFAGTPLYMSPEQLRDASRADARSDVFSLGTVLFELATGRRAFAGIDMVDIVKRVADVSFADPAELVPDLPERMVRAIRAALQESPEDRPQTAGALLALWEAGTSPADPRWSDDLVEALLDLHTPRLLPTVPESTRPRHNLGAAPDRFVGRREERATLAQALEAERLITLAGPAGAGKTRLAQEVGRDQIHRFPGGVWFCDLTGARSASDIAAAVGQALGVAIGRDPIATVGDVLLGRGSLLLVLDNFEQVVEHAETTVEAWLDRAPEARFLVTSRTPLDLLDEDLVRVSPLSLPSDSSEGDAMALFLQRAREQIADFTVADDNRDELAALVRDLDGLPLAIEIVAARVRDPDIATLRRRVLERLHRLSAPGATTARHRTLQAALEWSWELSTPEERAVLAQCSVFEGGWTARAAKLVVEPVGDTSVRELLERLTRRSLVRRVGDRFGLLLSVQTFAAARLAEAGREAEARSRHAGWVASWLQEHQQDGADTPQALRASEVANVLAGCRHTIASEPSADGWAETLISGLLLCADYYALDVVLGLADQAVDVAPDPVSRALLIGLRGRLRVTAGQTADALRDFDACIPVLKADGRTRRTLGALNYRGIARWRLGDLDGAVAALQEGLALADDHPFQRGHIQAMLGVIAQHQGRQQAERDWFERALDSHRASGNPRGEGMVLGELAAILEREGQLEASEALHRESIAVLQEHHDRRALATAWLMLGHVQAALGQSEAAVESVERARTCAVQSGARHALASACQRIGQFALQRGDLAEAGAALEQALTVARDINSPDHLLNALSSLAVARARQGSAERARALLDEASRLPQESNQGIVNRLVDRAEVAWRTGQLEAARQHLAEARAAARRLGVHTRSLAGQRLQEVEAWLQDG